MLGPYVSRTYTCAHFTQDKTQIERQMGFSHPLHHQALIYLSSSQNLLGQGQKIEGNY